MSHRVRCATLERCKEIMCNLGWRFLWQFYRLQILKSQGRMMMGLNWWKVIMKPFPFFKAHKVADFCVGAGNESRQELRENHTDKTVSSLLNAPEKILGNLNMLRDFHPCAKVSIFAFVALDPSISLGSPQFASLPAFGNRSISTVYSVSLQTVFIPRHRSLLSPTVYFTNAHNWN